MLCCLTCKLSTCPAGWLWGQAGMKSTAEGLQQDSQSMGAVVWSALSSCTPASFQVERLESWAPCFPQMFAVRVLDANCLSPSRQTQRKKWKTESAVISDIFAGKQSRGSVRILLLLLLLQQCSRVYCPFSWALGSMGCSRGSPSFLTPAQHQRCHRGGDNPGRPFLCCFRSCFCCPILDSLFLQPFN